MHPPARTDEDDRAVSPVVAIVLLVGITLLLAAVASVYFSTLTQPPKTEPDVDFEFGLDPDCIGDDVLSVDHVGGETLDPNRTYLVVKGTSHSFADLGVSDPMTAGDGVRVSAKNSNYVSNMYDGSVRVVWVHPSNEESFVIGKYQLPEVRCPTNP